MFRSANCICKNLKRSISTISPSPILEQLTNKTIIRVSGNEVSDYLQGLITNDINHLNEGVRCMYTMFLNTKGRILYDAIIYKTFKENTFLIECDTAAAESLQKHLKIYKLRKKIDITNLSDEYSLHVIFDSKSSGINEEPNLVRNSLDNLIFPSHSKDQMETSTKDAKIIKNVHIYKDPRMASLGYRVIAPKEEDIKQILAPDIPILNATENETYKWFRYGLGVGEGVNDLPPENSFPLEANCDYLHGVSFHKGCYIGQELTARTFHTGIIRKRLMPLLFSKIPTATPDTNIINNNVNLGKLRGIEGNAGLALLRIIKSLEQDIKIADGVATTAKPMWWPIEASKEKISAQRNE